ncbi:MAG: hypothetical protein CO163_08080 [Rhodobacterales bacterium CG_4_9_14_3_um_filter_71_31]|nr:MAG: hypothetical protein CO163_08080 [Rhodobacterales bacterium CG_4_9_14_3_um_filter_71_31]
MADKKRRHEAADPQQESPNDPIFVPDLSKIPGLAEKGKFERAVAGEMDFHDLYESICGVTDDSQDVEMYDGSLGVTQAFVTTHQRPVGVLRWNSNLASIYSNPGNVAGVRWCTGTLIADDLFLTAGHCFDQTGGGWNRPRVNGTTNIIPPGEIATNMSVEFDYQRNAAGVLKTPVSVAVVELVEYRLGGLDFAIARLAGAPGQTWGVTRLASIDANVGDMLCIIQHPAGNPKRIEAGPLTSFDGDRIRYNNIDTLGGSSGSGILRALDGCLVGVHTNGGCNAAMTGSNFGVRVARLLEVSPTLQSLPKHTNPSLDRIVTAIVPDRVTTVLRDRPTTALADRVTTVLRDRPTSLLADRFTLPNRDFRTSPLGDVRGTPNKALDDRKFGALDKQFSDRKTPGLDAQFDPAGGAVINPAVNPAAAFGGGVQPFVLATPHHAAVEGGEAVEAEAEAYEEALARLEIAMEVLGEQLAQMQAEHEALAAEYSQMMGQ